MFAAVAFVVVSLRFTLLSATTLPNVSECMNAFPHAVLNDKTRTQSRCKWARAASGLLTLATALWCICICIIERDGEDESDTLEILEQRENLFFFVFVYFLSSLAAVRGSLSRVCLTMEIEIETEMCFWSAHDSSLDSSRPRCRVLHSICLQVQLSRSPSSGQWSLYFYYFLISQAAISESSRLPGQLTSSPNCLFQFISERCDFSLRRLVKISDNSTLELHTCDHVSHVSLISCTARCYHKSLNCRKRFFLFLYFFLSFNCLCLSFQWEFSSSCCTFSARLTNEVFSATMSRSCTRIIVIQWQWRCSYRPGLWCRL